MVNAEAKSQNISTSGSDVKLTLNRIGMYAALVPAIVFGGLAAVDTAVEAGLIASDVVPAGVNQAATAVNGALDAGLVGAAFISYNVFSHFRHQVLKIKGEVTQDSKPHRLDIPLPRRRA